MKLEIKKEEAIQKLIDAMIEEVDKVSEEGELDRHCCQGICEYYIKQTVQLLTELGE